MSTEDMDDLEPDEYDYFNELERRYLLTLLLTEELGSQELVNELDAIATKLEDDDDSAEDEFYGFEERILQRFTKDHGVPPMTFPESDDPDLDAIQRRFRLLYFSKNLLQGEGEKKELLEFYGEAVKLFEKDLDAGIDEVDEKLTLLEDEFISTYFEEDEDFDSEEE